MKQFSDQELKELLQIQSYFARRFYDFLNSFPKKTAYNSIDSFIHLKKLHTMNDLKQKTLTKELSAVFNRLGVDCDIETPDFVLAEHVIGCLKSYKKEIVRLNDINRGTQEGKLLFAALAELTTKLYTNRQPEQVIEILQELHRRNTFEPGGRMNESNRSFCVAQEKSDAIVERPFDRALAERVNEEANKKNALLKRLAAANNEILNAAIPSTNPDDFVMLEKLLVNLYRHYE